MMFFLSLISCNYSVKTKNNGNDETNKVEHKNDFWSNSNQKSIKIDSTEFKVIAQKTSLGITLEKKASFESQITKLKKVLDTLKNKTDLAELRFVFIWANNIELLSNISKVPEIQSELKRSEIENKIVNSMGVISKHANKSSHLNEITSLFSEFNLSPYNYFLEKCYVDKRMGNSKNYEIGCGSIIFNLKEK